MALPRWFFHCRAAEKDRWGIPGCPPACRRDGEKKEARLVTLLPVFGCCTQRRARGGPWETWSEARSVRPSRSGEAVCGARLVEAGH
ncbi:hypothetical protein NDU88_000836 [Pleurodeles waltl]|uniref:Uncharacterized protein n=1 Tax=Pleurodeles waltl TaxID=8319 RepID=A0AAV7VXE5_PLEWA|nr:hypothetical protein NDU88_000836 [Pleurodeles waltl]